MVHVTLTYENNRAIIVIEDNGAGMDAERLKRALHGGFSSKSNGTGLGLSICQWIAHAHGGGITATSLPDHTVLTLRLPLQQSPSQPL